MRKTTTAILLSLWLYVPGWCQIGMEPLLQKMLTSERSTWGQLFSQNRQGLERSQLSPAFKQVTGWLKEGKNAQAWALAEAMDFVDWSIEPSRSYSAYAQLSIVGHLGRNEKGALAKQYLQELVAKHPESPHVQCEMGRHYLLTGQLASAEAPLRKAIELAPNWPDGYLWLGEYALVRGDAEAAKALFRKTLELDPKNAIAGDALNGLEKPQTQPFSTNQQAMAHFNRAESLFDSGKYQEAIREYDLALKDDPKMVKAEIYKGDAYLRAGNGEKAIECYRRAIVIDPADKQAYRFLGDVLESRYDAKGNVADLDEAIAAYQKALEIDANYKMARDNLERAVRKHK